MKLYMFRTVRLSIIGSLFAVQSAMVYVTQVCGQLSSRTRMERIWGETSTKNVLVKTKYDSFNWGWQTTDLHFSLGAVCPGWSTNCRNCWSDFAGDRRLTTGTVEVILVESSTNYRNYWSYFAGDRRQTTGTVEPILPGIVDKLQELLKWFWWDRRQTTGIVEMILSGIVD